MKNQENMTLAKKSNNTQITHPKEIEIYNVSE